MSARAQHLTVAATHLPSWRYFVSTTGSVGRGPTEPDLRAGFAVVLTDACRRQSKGTDARCTQLAGDWKSLAAVATTALNKSRKRCACWFASRRTRKSEPRVPVYSLALKEAVDTLFRVHLRAGGDLSPEDWLRSYDSHRSTFELGEMRRAFHDGAVLNLALLKAPDG